MSKSPVNAGSTREEMWVKILALRKQLEEREVAYTSGIRKMKVLCDSAIERYDELSRKLKTVRKILNSN